MKTTKISQVNVEAGLASGLSINNSSKPYTRRARLALLMTGLLLLLVPATQRQSKAQAIEPEYIPLNAVQLDQLVAPIALDPDPLVAQILIGSTFPDQVSDANNWVSKKMNLTQDQRAAGASNMSWDPSIKGLVVFPIVLDSMAKNNAWTVQLGNAYYNQPDDVMSAIQAMRLLAYKANFLVTTVHEDVEVSEDVIEILPLDSNAVFVQHYDPWQVWGDVVTAYPGYVEEPAPAGIVAVEGVSFDPPVSVGVDAHFGFSFGGWAPGWGGGAVVYNHNVYNSNSRSVANRGHFGGRDGRVFEHGGRGVPAGFHHGGQFGPGRSVPVGRTMPQRISRPRATPISHTGAVGRSTAAARNASNARSNSFGHAASAGRSPYANHTNSANRAANNASNNRAGVNGRSAMASHPPATSRPVGGNRSAGQSAPAGRSAGPSRISSNRPTSQGNSMGASRSMSRPASAGNSFGASHATSRPAAATRSFGGAQAMNRPASMGRSGSGSFGGGHTNGGGKR